MDLRSVSINDLARACAHSADAAEWEEFVRRTAPLTTLAVVRVARLWMNRHTAALVDDIVQEVYLKLCEQERRILREFLPRGKDSFLGLLRIVATSVANDYFRRQNSAKRGGKTAIAPLAADQAPMLKEMDGESGRLHRAMLFSQLDGKLRRAPEAISGRDRNLFWLYYRHGLTSEEIAALPAVDLTAKGVESAVRRVAIWLRSQVGPCQKENGSSPSREGGLTLVKEESLHSR